MKIKSVISIGLFFLSFSLFLMDYNFAQNKAEDKTNANFDDNVVKKEIISNLYKSAEHWNNSDLENYMSSYPKREDVLMQSGTSRIYGYTKLYNMYSNLFKDVDKRGILSFSDVEVTVFAYDTAMEIGKFTLEFKDGIKRIGYFTAILKKFPDGWKIVHDHS